MEKVKNNNEYLIECIEKKYDSHFENRLSKVFSASFNASNVFRELFCKNLLDLDSPTKNLYSETEVFGKLSSNGNTTKNKSKKGKSKLFNDIIIYSGDKKPCIILENKINAPFSNKQLESYEKIIKQEKWKKHLGKNKYVLFKSLKSIPIWSCHNWGKFYVEISNYLYSKKITNNSVDIFILNNFITYLEELNMHYIPIITKEQLKRVADTIFYFSDFREKKNIRDIKKIYSNNKIFSNSANPFEILDSFLHILNELYFRIIIEAPFFKKYKALPKYQFNPIISYIIPGENDNVKDRTLFIGFKLKINPKRVNILDKKNITVISFWTGLFLYKRKRNPVVIHMDFIDKNEVFLDTIPYYELKNGVNVDSYYDYVEENWNKALSL